LTNAQHIGNILGISQESEGLLSELSRAELYDACGVLFGPQVDVSFEFFRYLQPSGLRDAFRKKALETHPDRAKALGKDESKLNELFKDVVLAYEKLSSIIREDKAVLSKNKPDIQKNKRKTSARNKTHKKSQDNFYAGCIPKQELLIGRFLYYSGLISWRSLIQAIIWQWRQRPLIGQIALEWGMLSGYDIQMILKGRDFKERFGEYAVRKGYLSAFKLMALLGKQRGSHCPIGEYFVKQGILLGQELDMMVERQRIHNTNVAWGN
jgi:hypothetical protein